MNAPLLSVSQAILHVCVNKTIPIFIVEIFSASMGVSKLHVAFKTQPTPDLDTPNKGKKPFQK